MTQTKNAVKMEHDASSKWLLEKLKELAAAGRIKDISYAIQNYLKQMPGKRAFIRGKLPGIILNNYFSTVPNFKISKFREWSDKNPKWAERIKDSFSNPERLEAEVQKVIQESQR